MENQLKVHHEAEGLGYKDLEGIIDVHFFCTLLLLSFFYEFTAFSPPKKIDGHFGNWIWFWVDWGYLIRCLP